MHHLTEILKAHPDPQSVGTTQIKDYAAKLSECSLSCFACADACLAEKTIEKLRKCISSDLSCAECTQALANSLTRQTAPDIAVIRAMAQACEVACRNCAEECEKHADKHAHCDHCAKICRECEQLCSDLKRTA